MKQKTHSGAKKRLEITGKGKIMFKKPGKKHLLFGKSKRQKRSFKKGVVVHSVDLGQAKKLLPNNV